MTWRPLLVAALVLAGCASPPAEVREEESAVPAWVNDPPSESGRLYAVGMCERVRDGVERQRALALGSARAALAGSIRSQVTSSYLDETRATGGSASAHAQEYRHEVALVTEDEVVEGSEPVAWWVDRDGRAASQGTIFVLVRCDTSRFAGQKGGP